MRGAVNGRVHPLRCGLMHALHCQLLRPLCSRVSSEMRCRRVHALHCALTHVLRSRVCAVRCAVEGAVRYASD